MKSLLILLIFLSCKPQGPEAKWIYGTWYEKLDGGEIDFRKGGKVTWFGKEGTFSFEKNKTTFCVPRCKDGELHIKVDGTTFRTDYDVNKGKPRPASWTMSFENMAEMSKVHTIQGKKTRGLFLSSKRENGGPYKPDGVTRFDNGLFKYNNMTSGGIVNGKLVAGIWWGSNGLALYEKSSGKWKDIAPTGKLDSIGSLFYGRKVIINNFLTGNKFSLDTGKTWKKLPPISDLIGGKIGVNPVLLDKVAFQLEADLVEDGGDWSKPRAFRLYSVDLSKSKPKWKKVYDFPNDFNTNNYLLSLYTSEKVGDIYVFANPYKTDRPLDRVESRMFRSQDKGVTFEEIGLPELNHIGQVKASDKGVMIVGWKREEGKNTYALGQFNTETVSWNKIPLAQDIYTWYPYGESVLIYDWGRGLKRLNEDGSLTDFYQLKGVKENNFQSTSMNILGKEIYLGSLTIFKVK